MQPIEYDLLQNEISILIAATGHPNVVGIVEVLEDARYIYIVQDFIDGKDFYEFAKDSKNHRDHCGWEQSLSRVMK